MQNGVSNARGGSARACHLPPTFVRLLNLLKLTFRTLITTMPIRMPKPCEPAVRLSDLQGAGRDPHTKQLIEARCHREARTTSCASQMPLT